MKKKALVLLLSLLLLSLSACGSSGGSSGKDSPVSSDSSHGTGWNGGYYDANESGMPEDAGGSSVGGMLPSNTKIIYSADMSLETTEFDSASQSISQIVENLGGWFESRSIYQGGGYRSLRCTVRVPAQVFGTFLDQAGQAAHVTSRDEYAEDVSEAYYDNESRLATQRTKLERLQLLLSQATAMEDIISLESAISDTELLIEQLTGSLRKYDSLVGYSTVTLRLNEVYRLSSDEEPAVTFGQRLGSAFAMGLNRGISNLEEFCIVLARNWLSLLLFVVIIAAALLLYRRRRRGKFVPKPPQPPKPPEPPASNQ